MLIKYEKDILDAFVRIGKAPRGNQVADINLVIEGFIDEGYDSIILNASTGAGKSIIGAVVAEVLQVLSPLTFDDEGFEKAFASFILTGTNVLTDQYSQTFTGSFNFLQVKGTSNYECELLSTASEPKTGEDCCRTDIIRSGETELIALVDKFCGNCELLENRRRRRTIRHLITNYSFFFVDRLYADQFAPRTITVWDEAHLISDLFSEHCAVFISEKRLDLYADEIAQELECTNVDVFQRIKTLKTAIVKGTINEGNYKEHLESLSEVYVRAKVQAAELLKTISMSTDMKRYNRIKKIGKKYEDLNCKISDFFEYNFEHIFEYEKDKKECSVKPIFVGAMFDTLINSRYQLFMSATVSKPLLVKTLGLNPQTTKFIKLNPTFPKENKKVIFHGIDKLNYERMKDPKTIAKLSSVCSTIATRHIKVGESGIILAPSFDVTREIAGSIKGVKVFEHERGTKIADWIREFKDYSKPSVLISPSLWEGIDLSGDLSRFQIFVKAPYPSLGDKRTNYIASSHKELYTLATILKLVQGCGRSVRSEEDYAVTYMLDQQISWIWKNELNVWRSEFSESYQTFT